MTYRRRLITNFDNLNHTALVVLEDDDRQSARIIMDDGCYVLQTTVDGAHGRGWKTATHWFPEAAEALASIVAGAILLKQLVKDKQPPNTAAEGPWSPAALPD
jgi:hypothetical protein